MSVTEAQTSREIEIRLSQLQQHVACDSSGETRHLATTRRSLFMPYSKQIHCISDCHFRMSFNPCTGSTLAGFHALVLAAKLKAQSRQVTAQPLHGSAQTDRGARTRIHRDTHTHTHPHTHTHTHPHPHPHTLAQQEPARRATDRKSSSWARFLAQKKDRFRSLTPDPRNGLRKAIRVPSPRVIVVPDTRNGICCCLRRALLTTTCNALQGYAICAR